MTKSAANKLTEGQEMLLSRYHDGEVSFIEKLRAGLLVKRNPAASEFLTSLEELSSKAYSSAPSATEPCNLWDRISARIDAEERAALYLGKRSTAPAPTNDGLISRLLSSHTLLGGISGAAVAAAILVTVYPASNTKELTVINAEPSALVRAPQGFHTVTLPSGKDQSKMQDAQLTPRSLTAMEMDWMRGSGPLKIIQNPGSSSGVIWIKRLRNAPSSASPAPTPLLRRPSLTQRGIDETAHPQSE